MKATWIRSVETSSYCNFKCSYCPQPNDLGYEKGNMTPETFERVVYWASKLNPGVQPREHTAIWLQGFGEPLLNKNIFSFVGKMSKVMPVGFSTNGALLTDDNIAKLNVSGLSELVISAHDPVVAKDAYDRVKASGAPYSVGLQVKFNDDWAGQIKNEHPNSEQQYFHCVFIEQGGIHVLHNGDIASCCVNGTGYPILGSVYDDEIRHIDIEPIPLCKTCRSAAYLIPEYLKDYHPRASREERELMFWKDVEQNTKQRNVKKLPRIDIVDEKKRYMQLRCNLQTKELIPIHEVE